MGYWIGASLTPSSGRFAHSQWFFFFYSPEDNVFYEISKNGKWQYLKTRENFNQSWRKLASFWTLSFFLASTLPCILQSVHSCMESFCCIITDTIKEITGYRNWGSRTPQILYRGAKSFTNWVFCQNWCLSTRVVFLLFDFIFLLPVWPKLHVGHPFLLIKHASHLCTLFQPSTRSANVRYYYFRFSRYRALAQRLRSRRVFKVLHEHTDGVRSL